jgi:aryl-alcohol dehydrogenase-like predicted oxidoreductase
MKRQPLGRGGPPVSVMGLGCMVMSNLYGAADEAESIATIRHALDAGASFLDTSDFYGAGHNETLVGRALRDGYRGKAFVATKFGNVKSPDGRSGADGRPAFVKASCEASLRRLGVEAIDLYYQHRVDASVPIEDTVGAMRDLVIAGKVRHLGLCEAGAETLRRAALVHPIAALQTEYSLWTRFVEADILPTCRELGIAFVPYSPLGRGMLTGEIASLAAIPAGDRRRDHPRFSDENFRRNLALVQPLLSAARSRGVPAAQLALAWLLAQGDDMFPIPGTRRRGHLADNLAAADIALGADEARAIAALIDDRTVQGARYPANQLHLLGV